MKKAQVLVEKGSHRWLVVARDPDRPNHLIDTNEYVVQSGEAALITDPGGQEIFPAVFAALAAEMDPRQINTIFATHQDPDVISSLALWLSVSPKIKCWASWLWGGFIPHFGGDASTIVPVPDEGGVLPIGGARLQIVPAHYLHSSGNLHLYDPELKVLFTGDVGAALLPPEAGLFVTDFDAHIRHAEGFHRRWMGSNEARLDWCRRVSELEIDFLCPQHGAIYRGADAKRFISWFGDLQVGVLKGR